MDIIQLARLLQLVGFVLASVFGGILLDKAVGGRIADAFTAVFVRHADGARGFVEELVRRLMGDEPRQYRLPGLLLALLWPVAVSAIIVGYSTQVSALLWTGVALFSLYALFWLVGMPLLFLSPRVRAKTGHVLPDDLRITARDFLPSYAWLAPWGLFFGGPLVFADILLNVASAVMRMLANPRVPRAAFTVLGFLLLLAGLILDAVAAFLT